MDDANYSHSTLARPGADPNLWVLDPKVVFLNHGSFGSCPRPVLQFQQQMRDRMERQPVHFFVRDLERLLDEARHALAQFVGAENDHLVFIPNATSGINAVLRSLPFKAGDELLVTDQEYNACRNALNFIAERTGAKIVVAEVPFPIRDSSQFIDPLLAGVTARTRLVLVDHVVSQTGLVLPIGTLVRELTKRGVDALIDGAHAPGMIPLDLETLGAAYYTGNCHKWICAPKGAAFLYVRKDRQDSIRPLTISHGANSPRRDRSRFLIEFGWTGTWDPTAYLSVPEALRFMSSLRPGGWPEIVARNRALAVAARKLLCEALRIPLPCPDEMIGSLATIPIADAESVEPPTSPLYMDALQERLLAEHSIEVPIIPWPAPPKRLLRISAQLYNSLPEFERLAEILADWRRAGVV